MKIVLEGWIYAQRYKWDAPGAWGFSFFSGPRMAVLACENSTGYLPVMPYSVEMDSPADWNPVALQVSALEAEKAEALAAYQRSVASINERLGKLLALTNDAEPA